MYQQVSFIKVSFANVQPETNIAVYKNTDTA